MRFPKLLILGMLLSIFVTGCKKDDDGPEPVEIRDRGEQAIADDEAITAFLETHFYNYEEFENSSANFDYLIEFDTIAGENSDKTPLIESDLLTTRTITRDEVDYKVYILKVREGVGEHPTFADSTFQNYKGQLLNENVFDNTANPVWFDHPGILSEANPGIAVTGLTAALTEFGGASGFEVADDNTVTWNNDFGIGAVFVPSGLAYFASGTPSIPAYSPLIFSFKLYGINQADHDGDGIPSFMEDIDNNIDVRNDNSDSDPAPNYLDRDDDNDGTLTIEEIKINEDGTVVFLDLNNNDIVDHLDPDQFYTED